MVYLPADSINQVLRIFHILKINRMIPFSNFIYGMTLVTELVDQDQTAKL